MVRNISIKDGVYEKLNAMKKDRSFSYVIENLLLKSELNTELKK
jgi:predicted CopG family antitoxin